MKIILRSYFSVADAVDKLLSFFKPVALLGARLYVAWIFFASGLTKLRDWDSTLFLFEEEYQVPWLNFEVAAYLGTGGELLLPILLALGLFTSFASIGLFLFNIVAVISLEFIAPAAFSQHIIWGLLIALIAVWGPGRISADHWLRRVVG